MTLKIKKIWNKPATIKNDHKHKKNQEYSKVSIDFLNEAEWRVEKTLPSKTNHYSDHLENTGWSYINSGEKASKHYRRDLDALS